MFKKIIFILTLLFVASCQGPSAGREDYEEDEYYEEEETAINTTKTEVPSHPTSDITIFYNGVIYSADSKDSQYSAIVIKNGKITYLGDDQTALSQKGEQTEIVNLEGKMIIPGFHDVHIHPLEAGSEVGGKDCLFDSVKDLNSQEFHQIVQSCVEQSASDRGTDWVLGWGHQLDDLLKIPNPLSVIDKNSQGTPMAIMEATSHSVWANSEALAFAGIDRNTPNPVGGVIVKDAQGNPNGLLLENAGDEIFNKAMNPQEPYKSIIKEIHYEGLLWSIEEMAKYGITSIAESRVYWKRGFLEIWKKAQRENKLKTRTVLGLYAYPSETDQSNFNFFKQHYSNDINSLLRVSQIKIYNDGVIHNSTAALLAPYKSALKEIPKTNGQNIGLNYFDKNRLQKFITEMEKIGYDFHIHAIGDRATKESLDAIEGSMRANGGIPRRHRLTHVELVSPSDINRFKALGIIADFQMAGNFTHPENHIWAEPRIGERYKELLPIKKLLGTGAHVTLSSDWDVSELNPLIGISNVVKFGQMDLKQALKAYTIKGAYVLRQENITGSLEVGKQADLVILDKNLFNLSAADISKATVLRTILGGKTVFSK